MLMLISQRNGRLYAAVGHTTPKKHFQSFWFARLSIQPRLKSHQANTANQSHHHGREVEANGKKKFSSDLAKEKIAGHSALVVIIITITA